MTNDANDTADSNVKKSCQSKCCCKRKKCVAALVLVLALIGGAFAWHHHGGAWCKVTEQAMSHSTSKVAPSAEVVRSHAERITAKMMDRVSASAEQRQKAALIARSAADELQPLINAHRAARASIYSALSADTVDLAHLEQLRSEAVLRADAVSRKLTQEIGEMAAILTPEQRRTLLSRWAPLLGA